MLLPLRSWLAEHTRAVVTAVASAVIGIALVHVAGSCRSSETPTAPAIKALQAVNAELGKRVDELQASNVALTATRIKLSAQRDSLEHLSAAATHRIAQARTALPAPELVPDTSLRSTYRLALATIDSSLSELARRDSIEASYRRDSTLAAQQHTQDSISLALRLVQIHTVQGEADQWQAVAKASHPLCGSKCGAVLGVLGTILAAAAVHSVVH